MKTFLILAALFAAFGIVGEIDYQTAGGMTAEYAGRLPLQAAVHAGDLHHVAR